MGATFSTTIAGLVADRVDPQPGFLLPAAAGAAASVLLWVAMPETRPARTDEVAPATLPG